MKKLFLISLVILGCMAATGARAQEISFGSSGAFALVSDQGVAAPIYYDAADHEVVATVAECLASDIQAVTGQLPLVSTSADNTEFAVIAGTIGSSSLIDGMAASHKIDVSDISGKWEAYSMQLVDSPVPGIGKALVVCGSTPRGTAYGLFEISRRLGVSPWIWWADVAPEQMAAVYANGVKSVSQGPSVKFRGIFINDEDWGFYPWAANGPDKTYGNVGPNSYAKVMELLLRLRGNILWPAMHGCSRAFWDNKENLPVAKKYDIVLGSSHCEQMLRNNEWEWRRYEGNSGTNENWNYVTNRDQVQRYWRERVQESAGIDAMYTLGMRGVHDWGIGGYNTTEEMVAGLTEIIEFQRGLIKEYINPDPSQVPQTFIPYKEVLEAYNAGLQLPDDVTITWVDDNFGHMRQLPKPEEQARSGGNGLYYHLSYWGYPESYLWLSTIGPSLISYELAKAYDNNIRDLWVVNVGDIKPMEAETEFCMDMAWDIEAWRPENAHNYMRQWAAQTFGEEFADEIAYIKEVFFRLADSGKPEHIYKVSYSNAEMDSRIEQYADIVQRVDALKGRIPARLQDAFFEMIEYPVKGCSDINVKLFRAKQSLVLADQGQRDKALQYAAQAQNAFDEIVALTEKYNTGIAGGKWNKMMHYAPLGSDGFKMPKVATEYDIASVAVDPEPEPETTVVAASEYTAKGSSVKEIADLGIGRSALTVYPLDMTRYNADDTSAPYATFDVPVKAGKNRIAVRFLPTFAVNTTYNLRTAISIDGGEFAQTDINAIAENGKWNTSMLVGYTDVANDYESDEDKTIQVTVRLLDPGVTICDIMVTMPETIDLELTERVIKNYDFELKADGTPNTGGSTQRGYPYGWDTTNNLNGNSYGINSDAGNKHGDNACWINSTPMPEFQLSQTIPAGKLEAGYYKISCLLWVEGGSKLTNCRLFANNNVKYFGSEDQYSNVLTKGENNSYANLSSLGGYGLQDISVMVMVAENEPLTFGIRTSNKKNDGTLATDNSGWFKVDFFRIEKVGEYAVVPVYQDKKCLMASNISAKEYAWENQINYHFDEPLSPGRYQLSMDTYGDADGSMFLWGTFKLQKDGADIVNSQGSEVTGGYYSDAIHVRHDEWHHVEYTIDLAEKGTFNVDGVNVEANQYLRDMNLCFGTSYPGSMLCIDNVRLVKEGTDTNLFGEDDFSSGAMGNWSRPSWHDFTLAVTNGPEHRVVAIPDGETDIAALPFVNPRHLDLAYEFGKTLSPGDPVLGCSEWNGGSHHIDITPYNQLRIYGEPGSKAIVYLNRKTEALGDNVAQEVLIGQSGTGVLDLHALKEGAFAADGTLRLCCIMAAGSDESRFDLITLTENLRYTFRFPDGETPLSELPWNGTYTCSNRLGQTSDLAFLGEDTHNDYYDASDYEYLKVYGTPGESLRAFINRGAHNDFIFRIEIGDDGTGILDFASVKSKQGLDYIHINCIKAYVGRPVTVYHVSVCGGIANNIVKTIPQSCLATFSSTSNVAVPADVYVYKAYAHEDEVLIERVATGIIPANTGVILYSEVPGDKTLVITPAESDADFSGNELVATSVRANSIVPAGVACYALKANERVFARVLDGTEISANKAYLQIATDGGSAAERIKVRFGSEADGIGAILKDSDDDCYYTLQGLRLEGHPSQPGIYLHRGKKTIIK